MTLPYYFWLIPTRRIYLLYKSNPIKLHFIQIRSIPEPNNFCWMPWRMENWKMKLIFHPELYSHNHIIYFAAYRTLVCQRIQEAKTRTANSCWWNHCYVPRIFNCIVYVRLKKQSTGFVKVCMQQKGLHFYKNEVLSLLFRMLP